jgi:hypothetical protein
MSNPAPLGGDERPPPVPNADPLPVDEVPPAMPPAPAYDTTDRLEPTPAYDALAAEAPMVDPLGTSDSGSIAGSSTVDDFTTEGTGEERALTPEADYALAPNPTDAGPLGQVKALAADKPVVFLGAALAAGWLLGKITSRGGGDD